MPVPYQAFLLLLPHFGFQYKSKGISDRIKQTYVYQHLLNTYHSTSWLVIPGLVLDAHCCYRQGDVGRCGYRGLLSLLLVEDWSQHLFIIDFDFTINFFLIYQDPPPQTFTCKKPTYSWRPKWRPWMPNWSRRITRTRNWRRIIGKLREISQGKQRPFLETLKILVFLLIFQMEFWSQTHHRYNHTVRYCRNVTEMYTEWWTSFGNLCLLTFYLTCHNHKMDKKNRKIVFDTFNTMSAIILWDCLPRQGLSLLTKSIGQERDTFLLSLFYFHLDQESIICKNE